MSKPKPFTSLSQRVRYEAYQSLNQGNISLNLDTYDTRTSLSSELSNRKINYKIGDGYSKPILNSSSSNYDNSLSLSSSSSSLNSPSKKLLPTLHNNLSSSTIIPRATTTSSIPSSSSPSRSSSSSTSPLSPSRSSSSTSPLYSKSKNFSAVKLAKYSKSLAPENSTNLSHDHTQYITLDPSSNDEYDDIKIQQIHYSSISSSYSSRNSPSYCVNCSSPSPVLCMSCSYKDSQNTLIFYKKTRAAGAATLFAHTLTTMNSTKYLLKLIFFRLMKHTLLTNKRQKEQIFHRQRMVIQKLLGNNLVQIPFYAWKQYTKQNIIERKNNTIEKLLDKLNTLENLNTNLIKQVNELTNTINNLEINNNNNHIIINNQTKTIHTLKNQLNREQLRVHHLSKLSVPLMKYHQLLDHTLDNKLSDTSRNLVRDIGPSYTYDYSIIYPSDVLKDYTDFLHQQSSIKSSISKLSKTSILPTKYQTTVHELLIKWINYTSKSIGVCLEPTTGLPLDNYLPEHIDIKEIFELRTGISFARVLFSILYYRQQLLRYQLESNSSSSHTSSLILDKNNHIDDNNHIEYLNINNMMDDLKDFKLIDDESKSNKYNHHTNNTTNSNISTSSSSSHISTSNLSSASSNIKNYSLNSTDLYIKTWPTSSQSSNVSLFSLDDLRQLKTYEGHTMDLLRFILQIGSKTLALPQFQPMEVYSGKQDILSHYAMSLLNAAIPVISFDAQEIAQQRISRYYEISSKFQEIKGDMKQSFNNILKSIGDRLLSKPPSNEEDDGYNDDDILIDDNYINNNSDLFNESDSNNNTISNIYYDKVKENTYASLCKSIDIMCQYKLINKLISSLQSTTQVISNLNSLQDEINSSKEIKEANFKFTTELRQFMYTYYFQN